MMEITIAIVGLLLSYVLMKLDSLDDRISRHDTMLAGIPKRANDHLKKEDETMLPEKEKKARLLAHHTKAYEYFKSLREAEKATATWFRRRYISDQLSFHASMIDSLHASIVSSLEDKIAR